MDEKPPETPQEPAPPAADAKPQDPPVFVPGRRNRRGENSPFKDPKNRGKKTKGRYEYIGKANEMPPAEREATIIGLAALGVPNAQIARNIDWSPDSVRKCVARHREEIELKQSQIQNAVLDEVAQCIPNQVAVAKSFDHKRSPDAFGRLSDIAFPRRGGGVEVNIAGRDVVGAGAQVANITPPEELKRIMEMPEADARKELDAIEAEFERPLPPKDGAA